MVKMRGASIAPEPLKSDTAITAFTYLGLRVVGEALRAVTVADVFTFSLGQNVRPGLRLAMLNLTVEHFLKEPFRVRALGCWRPNN
jgi:hypothetical protein